MLITVEFISIRDGSEVNIDPDLMAQTLQYGPSTGFPPLVRVLTEFQSKMHGNSTNILSQEGQWGVLPVSGSMDGISKSFELFLNEGDTYLLEVPTYSGILAALGPHSATAICCEVDSAGLNPSLVREKLEETQRKGLPKPKFLYSCPTGTNPTGVSTTPDRRKEIYALACEFDLFIIEDDPYYFLHFGDQQLPSYLSFDTEGRVLRMDSFSKLLSAGIRLGFVTASTPLIQRLILHMQATQMHPCNISQALVAQLFHQWGHEKFMEHTKTVVNFYRKQQEAMVKAADTHLKDIVEFTTPNGGMFLWMKVPGIPDTKQLIMQRAIEKKVMFVPGNVFFPDAEWSDLEAKSDFKQYIRASYSFASADEMNEGFKRLREAIEEEMSAIHKN